jgi:hypothetical protein
MLNDPTKPIQRKGRNTCVPNTGYRMDGAVWNIDRLRIMFSDVGLCYQTVNVISLAHRHLQPNETAMFARDRTVFVMIRRFFRQPNWYRIWGAKIINRSVSICIEVWRYLWQPPHLVPVLVRSDAARRQNPTPVWWQNARCVDFVSSLCNEDICVVLIMLRWLTGDSGIVIRKDLWNRRFVSAWIYWWDENIRAGSR